MRRYGYVGPEQIRRNAEKQPAGRPIERRSDLVEWVRSQDEDWATYVVAADGVLRVAPRRSEHVACAGGGEVLGAGELHVDRDGAIDEISNLSTGYCPEIASWEAVRIALDRAGVAHPGGFTFAVEFRRCERCGERNVIKDEHYACAVCDAPLPAEWNFQ
jgi:hypothetical protein